MDTQSVARIGAHTPHRVSPSEQRAFDFRYAVLTWRTALDRYASGRIGFAELVEACPQLADASRRRRRGGRQ
jgi:hypothetical protein